MFMFEYVLKTDCGYSFFLSWVSKTQPYHLTKRMANSAEHPISHLFQVCLMDFLLWIGSDFSHEPETLKRGRFLIDKKIFESV